VAERLHQGVHADVGVGQLSGVGVSQPVHECAPDRLGVWASAPEGPSHPRLYGAAGDPLAVPANEERRVRWPS
jgi:hypothetical protein